MKKDTYQKRFYRQWLNSTDLIKRRIVIKETDLEILTDKPQDEHWLEEKILGFRRDIQTYIAKDRRFLTELKPMTVELDAPLIIKKMAQAAELANVGPMAAVAGGIAQLLGEELLEKGCCEVIIENGGDIFLSTKKNRLIVIFAGKSRLSGKLNLKINPNQTPCGICTSSGSVGHSLSFGKADSVTVLAKDAFLADAVATSTCNLVKSAADFNRAIEFAKNISGVFGVVVILKNHLGSWGDIEFS